MTERCTKCGLKSRGFTSPLGDPLCERHYTQIAGMVVGGQAAGLPGAVVGPGLLRWVRSAMHPGRSREKGSQPPSG